MKLMKVSRTNQICNIFQLPFRPKMGGTLYTQIFFVGFCKNSQCSTFAHISLEKSTLKKSQNAWNIGGGAESKKSLTYFQ